MAAASQVKELAEQIQQIGVSTIFVEATKRDRVMNNVARAASVEVSSEKLITDDLGNKASYVEMMSHNTCSIALGLGGKCQPFQKSIVTTQVEKKR